ncbi:MAG: cation:proton antiporter [Candidatus Altiarchaeota archaeon]|nr:cation:proton antiporter [Candidatus Altiarchaeota archaeon]
MELILVIVTVCLSLAFIFSETFYRLRHPKVLGQIIAGVFLGLPVFASIMRSDQVFSFISSLADLGIVFLMLLVGTKISVHRLLKSSKEAMALALLGYTIPFAGGFLFMQALAFLGLLDVGLLASVIVGICLAISAEAITIEILMEYGMLNSSVGALIMEAGMIDDLLGVLSLAAVIGYVEGGGIEHITSLPGDFLTFVLVSYILGFTVLPRAAKAVWKEKSEPAVFSLAIIFGLIIVLLSSFFGLSSVVGAFIAGVIIQLTVKNRLEEKEIVESLEIVTFGLVIPFFFIYIGLNINLAYTLENIYLVLALTFIALSGKMAAAHMLSHIYHVKKSHIPLIGWAANPRGAVELVIASIALERNLIGVELFSVIVSMAVLSAIISPIMFKRTCESGSCHVEHHHLKTISDKKAKKPP